MTDTREAESRPTTQTTGNDYGGVMVLFLAVMGVVQFTAGLVIGFLVCYGTVP